jgi:hypothetical protein
MRFPPSLLLRAVPRAKSTAASPLVSPCSRSHSVPPQSRASAGERSIWACATGTPPSAPSSAAVPNVRTTIRLREAGLIWLAPVAGPGRFAAPLVGRGPLGVDGRWPGRGAPNLRLRQPGVNPSRRCPNPRANPALSLLDRAGGCATLRLADRRAWERPPPRYLRGRAAPKEQPPRNLSGERTARGRALWRAGAHSWRSRAPHRRGRRGAARCHAGNSQVRYRGGRTGPAVAAGHECLRGPCP